MDVGMMIFNFSFAWNPPADYDFRHVSP